MGDEVAPTVLAEDERQRPQVTAVGDPGAPDLETGLLKNELSNDPVPGLRPLY
jgi:hypothetical protein